MTSRASVPLFMLSFVLTQYDEEIIFNQGKPLNFVYKLIYQGRNEKLKRDRTHHADVSEVN